MDVKDKQILELLKEDSSLTTRQISKKTRIPITTVHKRIKKLQKEGIIKRYTIEVDYEKIGKSLGAYVLVSVDLKLLKDLKKTQYYMTKELKKLPEVEKVDIVIGSVDIICYLRLKDIKELDKTLFNNIQKIDGVINTQTLVIIHG